MDFFYAVKFIVVSSSLVCLSACVTSKTYIGNYREAINKNKSSSKYNVTQFFWKDLILIDTIRNSKSDYSFKIVKRQSIYNRYINKVTGGMINSYHVKIKVKKNK